MPKARNIEESPLLSNDRSMSGFQSTIKSDAFEPKRLTDRQLEEEGNSLRILIYVVIVIIIGVGTALLIRNLISRNEDTTDDDQQEQTLEEETVEAVKVNKVVQSDSNATNVAKNADYVDSTILTLGDASLDVTNVSLNVIEILRYSSFTRMILDYTGTTTNVPQTTFGFDATKKQLTIEPKDGVTLANDLKKDNTVGGLITEIRFDSVNNKFIVVLSEDAKYRVVQVNGDLYIDFKTLTELAKPETTTQTNTDTTDTSDDTADDTTDDTTDDTSNPPSEVNYTNELSLDQQYIVSKVTGNTVAHNRYYFYDQGSYFEFSWGHRGDKGDTFIPNATAYYKEENGKNYIFVEIENLSQELFNTYGITSTDLSAQGVDTSASNFVRVDLVNFSNGKATYKVEVRAKKEFALNAEEAYGETGQLITLKMKD